MLAEKVRQMLLDRSDAESFCFELPCQECGEIWKSRPIRFSRAGVKPGSEGKSIVFDALYEKEKQIARELAVKEAMQNFNICPICGRLVCDRCFMLCEDLDMCTSCAGKLEEPGERVL